MSDLPPITEKDAVRFWQYVDKRGPDECWEWTGGRHEQGYGRFKMGHSLTVRAHRVSWAIHFGNLDGHVLHRCDNPPCVNPAHLFLGTIADNMADAAAKGRTSTDNTPKLTAEKVREARRLHQIGVSSKTLAQMYGVHISTMRRVIRGERWTTV